MPKAENPIEKLLLKHIKAADRNFNISLLTLIDIMEMLAPYSKSLISPKELSEALKKLNYERVRVRSFNPSNGIQWRYKVEPITNL